jgi:hypothetical protein
MIAVSLAAIDDAKSSRISHRMFNGCPMSSSVLETGKPTAVLHEYYRAGRGPDRRPGPARSGRSTGSSTTPVKAALQGEASAMRTGDPIMILLSATLFDKEHRATVRLMQGVISCVFVGS